MKRWTGVDDGGGYVSFWVERGGGNWKLGLMGRGGSLISV